MANRAKPKTSILTRCELAHLVGLTPDSVTRYISLGMPGVIETGGGRGKTTKIDLARALPWLLARAPAPRPGKLTARDRYYTARAEEVEMTNRVNRGELLEARDIDKAWAATVIAVRERLLGLAGTALQRGLVTPEREEQLDGLMRDALRELAARGQREAEA